MKTALVTGGNKGIGYAICQGLAEKGWHVLLASRDPQRGKDAAQRLNSYGKVEHVEVDVSDDASIQALTSTLSSKHIMLDALVNNAGIYLDKLGDDQEVTRSTMLETLSTNTLGPWVLAHALAPLMGKGAQIVNMSSGMGQLSEMGSGSPAYRMSKTALNAATRILAIEFKPRGILVNAMCPGWVKTDMGGEQAPRTTQQGADTALWLVEGGAGNASGGFYRNRASIPW